MPLCKPMTNVVKMGMFEYFIPIARFYSKKYAELNIFLNTDLHETTTGQLKFTVNPKF